VPLKISASAILGYSRAGKSAINLIADLVIADLAQIQKSKNSKISNL